MVKTFQIVFCFIFLSTLAKAEIFPPRSGNLDVLYMDNAYTDIASKIWMIDRAQKSVAVTAFILGMDTYGVSIASALRRAADRGVEVRVMYEGMIGRTLGKDLRLRLTDILVDPSLKRPAQVINMSIMEKMRTRIALNEYLHEKIIMVDVLTPNEMIYFGGRDLGIFSRTTIDSGYIIRPLDRKYYYVGDDIRIFYNSLWSLLGQYFTQAKTERHHVESALEAIKKIESLEDTASQQDKKEFQEFIKILAKKPSREDELMDFQFRPETTQVITNEFLRNVIIDIQKGSLAVRPDMYAQDDILNAIVHMVEKSNKVKIVAYASHYVPPLQEAFKKLIRNGQLYIYTNGYEVMKALDSIGMSAVSYDYSKIGAKMLEEEVKNNGLNPDNLKIHFLDRESIMKQSNGVQNYLHRKLMLFNDNYVLTGSYNFTESSSSKNDEFVVVFKDARMNAHHTLQNRFEGEQVYKKVNVHEESPWSFVKNSFKRLIMGDFVKAQY